MCIFFGPKNKTPKNKKMPFSAPKTKKKTKFGRPLVTAHANGLPFAQGSSVTPSGRLPLSRLRPIIIIIIC